MEKMKLIEEEELAQLLLDSAELHALEAGGVDNWDGYDYVMSFTEFPEFKNKSVNDYCDQTDEELIKNYKSK